MDCTIQYCTTNNKFCFFCIYPGTNCKIEFYTHFRQCFCLVFDIFIYLLLGASSRYSRSSGTFCSNARTCTNYMWNAEWNIINLLWKIRNGWKTRFVLHSYMHVLYIRFIWLVVIDHYFVAGWMCLVHPDATLEISCTECCLLSDIDSKVK